MAAVAGVILCGGIAAATAWQFLPSKKTPESSPVSKRHQKFGDFVLWWDDVPQAIRKRSVDSGTGSNIHPADYAGPDACKNCHKKQYEGWSQHAHRWMNALVDDAPIKGDFQDRTFPYMGGDVSVSKQDDGYHMRLVRGEVSKDYIVTQTIGSRFFQYYIGRQLAGPETADHPVYRDDHVLPLGYWIDRKEWVPVVHVHGEHREQQRHDPFLPRTDWPVQEFAEYAGNAMDLYRSQCNFCHTTFAIGDMFVRGQKLMGLHVPRPIDVSLPDYVRTARPEMWPTGQDAKQVSDNDFATLLKEFRNFAAPDHAVTLGISCEACHLGAKEHAAGKLKKPKFFPHGPEVSIHAGADFEWGRHHDNVNWACGRCHAGDRPQYAAGMATWNSTEYTDAMRGACYSQLTCIRCHDPHQTLGQGWSQSPVEDDAICLSCHQQLAPEPARMAHTRHSLTGEGSRCMNCHMPRINEGLQDVVRTHMIYSPTNAAMIEANQPNACNLCHTDRPIDWTLTHLQEWYGKTYSSSRIWSNYPERKQPVAVGWLKKENEAVRLVAADCLTRTKSTWALPELIGALDDTYLLNRQFARMGLESMLGEKLSDYGYLFYQTADERRGPLQTLRQRFAQPTSPATPPADASSPSNR